MKDIKKLMRTLDLKRKEFESLAENVKDMIGKSSLNEKDVKFFNEIYNEALQGKEININSLNERVIKIKKDAN